MSGKGRVLGSVAIAVSLLVSGCIGSRGVSQHDGFHLTLPPAPSFTIPETQFVVTTTDNARATATLAALLVEHREIGLRVLALGTDWVGVARGPYKYLLQPQVRGPGRLNTLLVKQLYAVKDKFVGHDDQLAELCFEIDTTVPFVHAHVMPVPHGALFEAQSELRFGTTLRLDTLPTYLDHLKQATLARAGKRLARYVK